MKMMQQHCRQHAEAASQ